MTIKGRWRQPTAKHKNSAALSMYIWVAKVKQNEFKSNVAYCILWKRTNNLNVVFRGKISHNNVEKPPIT